MYNGQSIDLTVRTYNKAAQFISSFEILKNDMLYNKATNIISYDNLENVIYNGITGSEILNILSIIEQLDEFLKKNSYYESFNKIKS